MASKKNKEQKSRLHPRNKNIGQYDLNALASTSSALKKYIFFNKYGNQSIDFSNPIAVKLLNKALLNYYYGIKSWDFPDENLCPAVPGRADYIHYIADLLSENNKGFIPKGQQVVGLDIGTGASCIYPILGVTEYDWTFIGSDINPNSIASAQYIIQSNLALQHKITCRLQNKASNIFQGILKKDEKVDFVICNPPFHSSRVAAQKGTQRKLKNLLNQRSPTPSLNFAGIGPELIYAGGELQFIQNMVKESEQFANNCLWFSTLVSKEANLKGVFKFLKKVGPYKIKKIPMGTANKSSRIVAWTFLSKAAQIAWQQKRWTVKDE